MSIVEGITGLISLGALGVSFWAVIIAKRSHVVAMCAAAMETAETAVKCALGRASHFKFDEALEFVEQANGVESRVPQDMQQLIDRTERVIRAMSERYAPTLDFPAKITADTDEGRWWRDAQGEQQEIFAALEKICRGYWKN